MRSTPVTPTLFRSSVRLSPCQLWGDFVARNAPVNRLPPSLGTRFMFRPPVIVSADPPAVWYTASCTIASLW